MPKTPFRRPGAVRLVLACLVCVLAPAAAEALTTRYPPHSGFYHGHQAPRIKAAGVAKRAPAKAKVPAARIVPAVKPAETAAPGKPSEQAGTWTAGEPSARACFRSRRKLWQADEGWIVKKVNVCP